MSDFLSRLKTAVHLSKDSEVAELLGMTATALSERKKRNSIPVKKLLDLAKSRPDLRIDVLWVVTGATKNFGEPFPVKHALEAAESMARQSLNSLCISDEYVELVILSMKKDGNKLLSKYALHRGLISKKTFDGLAIAQILKEAA